MCFIFTPETKLWKYHNKCTIIKNCDKNLIFRFRLASERINYLLIDVKETHRKKFDIHPFNKSWVLKKENAE